MKKNWKVIAVSAGGVLVLAVLVVLALNRSGAPSESDALVDVPQEDTTVLLYGIDVGKYDLAENTVEFGETIGQIFGRYGVGPGLVDQIARKSEPVFSLRGIKAGQKYTTFQTKDSAARLAYFVYEASMTDYLGFGAGLYGYEERDRQTADEDGHHYVVFVELHDRQWDESDAGDGSVGYLRLVNRLFRDSGRR